MLTALVPDSTLTLISAELKFDVPGNSENWDVDYQGNLVAGLETFELRSLNGGAVESLGTLYGVELWRCDGTPLPPRTKAPTLAPTLEGEKAPGEAPSAEPSKGTSASPAPTFEEENAPSEAPSAEPSKDTSTSPAPTFEEENAPSEAPSAEPSKDTSASPAPTFEEENSPSEAPSAEPSKDTSASPAPTFEEENAPSEAPSAGTTFEGEKAPSEAPSAEPSKDISSTRAPTLGGEKAPSEAPRAPSSRRSDPPIATQLDAPFTTLPVMITDTPQPTPEEIQAVSLTESPLSLSPTQNPVIISAPTLAPISTTRFPATTPPTRIPPSPNPMESPVDDDSTIATVPAATVSPTTTTLALGANPTTEAPFEKGNPMLASSSPDPTPSVVVTPLPSTRAHTSVPTISAVTNPGTTSPTVSPVAMMNRRKLEECGNEATALRFTQLQCGSPGGGVNIFWDVGHLFPNSPPIAGLPPSHRCEASGVIIDEPTSHSSLAVGVNSSGYIAWRLRIPQNGYYAITFYIEGNNSTQDSAFQFCIRDKDDCPIVVENVGVPPPHFVGQWTKIFSIDLEEGEQTLEIKTIHPGWALFLVALYLQEHTPPLSPSCGQEGQAIPLTDTVVLDTSNYCDMQGMIVSDSVDHGQNFVGYSDGGEYVSWEVNVPQAASYTFSFSQTLLSRAAVTFSLCVYEGICQGIVNLTLPTAQYIVDLPSGIRRITIRHLPFTKQLFPISVAVRKIRQCSGNPDSVLTFQEYWPQWVDEEYLDVVVAGYSVVGLLPDHHCESNGGLIFGYDSHNDYFIEGIDDNGYIVWQVNVPHTGDYAVVFAAYTGGEFQLCIHHGECFPHVVEAPGSSDIHQMYTVRLDQGVQALQVSTRSMGWALWDVIIWPSSISPCENANAILLLGERTLDTSNFCTSAGVFFLMNGPTHTSSFIFVAIDSFIVWKLHVVPKARSYVISFNYEATQSSKIQLCDFQGECHTESVALEPTTNGPMWSADHTIDLPEGVQLLQIRLVELPRDDDLILHSIKVVQLLQCGDPNNSDNGNVVKFKDSLFGYSANLRPYNFCDSTGVDFRVRTIGLSMYYLAFGVDEMGYITWEVQIPHKGDHAVLFESRGSGEFQLCIHDVKCFPNAIEVPGIDRVHKVHLDQGVQALQVSTRSTGWELFQAWIWPLSVSPCDERDAILLFGEQTLDSSDFCTSFGVVIDGEMNDAMVFFLPDSYVVWKLDVPNIATSVVVSFEYYGSLRSSQHGPDSVQLCPFEGQCYTEKIFLGPNFTPWNTNHTIELPEGLQHFKFSIVGHNTQPVLFAVKIVPTVASTLGPSTTSVSTIASTTYPTRSPIVVPTAAPTLPLATGAPTWPSTLLPTKTTTSAPMKDPTFSPTSPPQGNRFPTSEPTRIRTETPSESTSFAPARRAPTQTPTVSPRDGSTSAPALFATRQPTQPPTKNPLPTSGNYPTTFPTRFSVASTRPTSAPRGSSSHDPTMAPNNDFLSTIPASTSTNAPYDAPTGLPLRAPSSYPTRSPSLQPAILSDPVGGPLYTPSLPPTLPPTFPDHGKSSPTSKMPTSMDSLYETLQPSEKRIPRTSPPVDSPGLTLSIPPTTSPATNVVSLQPSRIVSPSSAMAEAESSYPTIVPTLFATFYRTSNGVQVTLFGVDILTEDEISIWRDLCEEWLEDYYNEYVESILVDLSREVTLIQVKLDFVSQVVQFDRNLVPSNTLTYNEVIKYTSSDLASTFSPETLRAAVYGDDATVAVLVERLRDTLPSMSKLEGIRLVTPEALEGEASVSSGLSLWMILLISIGSAAVMTATGLKYFGYKLCK